MRFEASAIATKRRKPAAGSPHGVPATPLVVVLALGEQLVVAVPRPLLPGQATRSPPFAWGIFASTRCAVWPGQATDTRASNTSAEMYG